MREGSVYWLTGLSGSGKTTIAGKIYDKLSSRSTKVVVVDGDVVRKELNKHLGFSFADIRRNNISIANLCIEKRKQYDYIFVPIISPFCDVRKEVKAMIGSCFYLVYVKASLEEVIRRDAKGLYKKALRGDIDNFIGVADHVPYEPPSDADIVLDTEKYDASANVDQLISFIEFRDQSL